VGSCHHDGISGSVKERTVGPGDNVTLYCPCKLTTEEDIVWLRNCSHENQPTLVIKNLFWAHQRPFPHFKFMPNSSSSSFDLLITNVTDANEGVYYCGTMKKTEKYKKSTPEDICRCSNIATRLTISVAFCHHDGISGSVKEVTARPGENITLYCDCNKSTGVYIVWFRNCSHENQPTFVLNSRLSWSQQVPRFKFIKNSTSFDLLITNITDSDEGVYYCGTTETKVEIGIEKITSRDIYRYSNITTRLTVKPSPLHVDVNKTQQNCDVDWKLLFFLCLSFVFISAIFSSLLGEDVCYAAPEICQASQRPKRKSTAKSSDFCTYSAISVGSCHHDGISGSVKQRTVGPGDNITLYCDCNKSTAEGSIVWLRNCSHENQPTLVLNSLDWAYQQPFPRFKFMQNSSSNSFNLLITNVTDADEGVYYCGTMKKTEKNKKSTPEDNCRYSNIATRLTIILDTQDNDKPRATTRKPREGEDVCYAALEIRHASQRPKRKSTAQNSDFCTYSAINTSRV
ncbi:unnamed protein product, partial [Menidia menidia]